MLTPASWEVLRGETQVSGWPDPACKLPVTEKAAIDTESEERAVHHPDLFEQLCQKRKELADQVGVPPYAVFPDKTLIEMATFFPTTDDDFLATFGVGAAKLEKYGPEFMALIRDFCTTHAVSEVPERKSPVSGATKDSSKEKRHFQVGRLYHEGASITEIANRFRIKPVTIFNHLFRFFQEDNRISSGRVIEECSLPSDLQKKALRAFDSQGHQFLKPVFEVLDRQIHYDDLHILRLYYLYMNGIDCPPEKEGD